MSSVPEAGAQCGGPARWDLCGAPGDRRPCRDDRYDFLRLPFGELGLAIGDVSGKGVSAALVMSSLQAALRVSAPLESDLGSLAAQLNTLVHGMTQTRKYVTLFFGCYHPASGSLR